MAYQAKVRKSDNIVVSVESATQEWADEWNQSNPNDECFYIRTWYDAKDKENPLDFRANYAGLGYFYDQDKDVFYSLDKPFSNWELNALFQYEAPIAKPDDNKIYTWNESTQEWDKIEL
jgi:hypothetical protein